MSISLSFDIGHSSIGWAVLSSKQEIPDILGCGVVTFPAEDCQNQQRAAFRRQRRHVAATRNRIKRLESFLVSAGMLETHDVEYCRESPHPWPWLLAAKVLRGGERLSNRELWAVIRWYAHNRGYDGNALWAGDDSDPDDVKKVQAARELMTRENTTTMCETVCALMDIDVTSEKNPDIKHYFKGENAAFPRNVVLGEMRSIIEKHDGFLKGVSGEFIRALLDDWKLSLSLGFKAKLPARYEGGLLFGQLKPRFENRIIPTCRITGEKTPGKHSRGFYRFRWAMFINNLRVKDEILGGSRPLSANERKQLNQAIEAVGYFNKTSLTKALVKELGVEPTNLEAMLLLPEMEKALTLDPARREIAGKKYKAIWNAIPEDWQTLFLNQLFNQRNYRSAPPSWGQWRMRMVTKGNDLESFDAALRELFEAEQVALAKKKNTQALPDFESFLKRPIRISTGHKASGRAPYAKRVLNDAYNCVMQGEEPRAKGGPLEETDEVRGRQRDEGIDQTSNNHLVRHRLKIFVKTLSDLVNHYADGDPSKVDWVGVEVIRDIVEFSGKTAKEKARLLGEQLWHHRKISKFLEKEREASGGNWQITPGLIKKVRIADDLGWKCPYTGKAYSLSQIIHGEVDKEHIIPRSKRPTDALHALVLSFSKVNSEKANRTGMQYIEDTKDSSHTLTPKQFKELVSKLKRSNGPSKDDERRCMKRKIALLTLNYEARGKTKEKTEGESIEGFTEGSLSQTSYINKLAARQVDSWFSEHLPQEAKLPQVIQLSGSVTAATRFAWNLFDQLAEACPETRDKIKTDVREITHLHHALDALAIGLTAHRIPRDGRVWALLSRRSIRNSDDQAYMRMKLGRLISFTNNGEWKIQPLEDSLKSQVVERLKEKRVVRHNPRTMRGLRVQQNIWRIESEDPDDPSKKVISMRPRNEDGVKVQKRKTERNSKLLGSNPEYGVGKLKALKGALIVEDNYGVALDPEPKVIPYRQVWKQLNELRVTNPGKPVRVLRNGDIFKVLGGRYAGVWRVHSIKDANMGLVLDIASPELVKAANKTPGAKMNVLLKTLINSGLVVSNLDFSGSEC